jgi:hypothetical protein
MLQLQRKAVHYFAFKFWLPCDSVAVGCHQLGPHCIHQCHIVCSRGGLTTVMTMPLLATALHEGESLLPHPVEHPAIEETQLLCGSW